MNRSTDGSTLWILYLTAALLYAAALLRSLLNYWTSPALYPVLGLLAVWLVLFAGDAAIFRRWHRYFPLYLVLQSTLAFALLSMPGSADYFAVLFCILSMQVMQRFKPTLGWVCIGLFTPVMAVPLAAMYGAAQGIAFVLIYTAGDVLLASYALATRRAQTAHAQSQSLVRELEKANQQIQALSIQREKLAAVRERHRLARDLHDAATQTVFSMTLATQSALLLLDRDPGRVGAQLERLNQLAQTALSEMHTLISELRPEKMGEGGLVGALREHLAKGHFSECLAVSLHAEGDQPLTLAEEQGLFRIAQEALNNIVKHARASSVWIRLDLGEPLSLEVQDDGCGFELGQVQSGGRVGLSSMCERAAEIGWTLHIVTSHGAGTRVRVEKATA